MWTAVNPIICEQNDIALRAGNSMQFFHRSQCTIQLPWIQTSLFQKKMFTIGVKVLSKPIFLRKIGASLLLFLKCTFGDYFLLVTRGDFTLKNDTKRNKTEQQHTKQNKKGQNLMGIFK